MLYRSSLNWAMALLSLVVTTTTGQTRSNYVPVVLVAGPNTDHSDMSPLQDLIKKYLPDIYVKNVHIGKGTSTIFWNMCSQINEFVTAVQSDHNLYQGCNIIGFCEGGLVARYYIEYYNTPRVYNYIALATPQRGYYGPLSALDKKYKWLDSCDPFISDILYLNFFQQYLSIAGYWKDPLNYEKYLHCCQFLPYLNNERNHCYAQLFKDNITKLHNMVLIRALCDSVIQPSQSEHFGFYQIGTDDTIESLFDSQEFQTDALGLKTLFEHGKLHLLQINGDHYDTVTSEENFVQNIIPFLTSPTLDGVVEHT